MAASGPEHRENREGFEPPEVTVPGNFQKRKERLLRRKDALGKSAETDVAGSALPRPGLSFWTSYIPEMIRSSEIVAEEELV